MEPIEAIRRLSLMPNFVLADMLCDGGKVGRAGLLHVPSGQVIFAGTVTPQIGDFVTNAGQEQSVMYIQNIITPDRRGRGEIFLTGDAIDKYVAAMSSAL